MKINRSASNSHLSFFILTSMLLVPGVSGCMFLSAPPTDPVPAPIKEPTGWVFDPADGTTAGTALNKLGDPVLPDGFTIPADKVESADMVSILSRDNGKDGPVADPVHLAGIIAPKKGQPGWLEANAAIINWMSGKVVDVESDPVYPTDLDGRRMVAIKFKGAVGGPHEKDLMLLNRMLVRAGYAIVDLYSPTSFDSKTWLSDEAYARRLNLGLWKQPDTFTILQQRVPANAALESKNKLKVIVGSGPAPAAKAPAAKPGGAPKAGTPALPAPAKASVAKPEEKATPGQKA